MCLSLLFSLNYRYYRFMLWGPSKVSYTVYALKGERLVVEIVNFALHG